MICGKPRLSLFFYRKQPKNPEFALLKKHRGRIRVSDRKNDLILTRTYQELLEVVNDLGHNHEEQ